MGFAKAYQMERRITSWLSVGSLSAQTVSSNFHLQEESSKRISSIQAAASPMHAPWLCNTGFCMCFIRPARSLTKFRVISLKIFTLWCRPRGPCYSAPLGQRERKTAGKGGRSEEKNDLVRENHWTGFPGTWFSPALFHSPIPPSRFHRSKESWRYTICARQQCQLLVSIDRPVLSEKALKYNIPTNLMKQWTKSILLRSFLLWDHEIVIK